jgi:uncharacterized protein
MDMLKEQMRTLIKDVCSRGTGPFDDDFFNKHINVVAQIADTLAQTFHADREIVALAAYLHDISAIEDYAKVSNHHILGGERAGEILSAQGYPAEKIAAVRRCIFSHSAPVPPGQGTMEEVCVSNADAASQILMPGYWLRYAFTAKRFSYEQGLAWYTKAIDSHWNSMAEEAKAIVAEAYHAEKILFTREAQKDL